MKIVKEHIEFERGLEPSNAMNIGIKNLAKKYLLNNHSTGHTELEKELISRFLDLPLDEIYLICDNGYDTKEYTAKIFNIINNSKSIIKDEYYTLYITKDGKILRERDGRTHYLYFSGIDVINYDLLNSITESIDFERGLNPIGKDYILNKKLSDIFGSWQENVFSVFEELFNLPREEIYYIKEFLSEADITQIDGLKDPIQKEFGAGQSLDLYESPYGKIAVFIDGWNIMLFGDLSAAMKYTMNESDLLRNLPRK